MEETWRPGVVTWFDLGAVRGSYNRSSSKKPEKRWRSDLYEAHPDGKGFREIVRDGRLYARTEDGIKAAIRRWAAKQASSFEEGMERHRAREAKLRARQGLQDWAPPGARGSVTPV